MSAGERKRGHRTQVRQCEMARTRQATREDCGWMRERAGRREGRREGTGRWGLTTAETDCLQ